MYSRSRMANIYGHPATIVQASNYLVDQMINSFLPLSLDLSWLSTPFLVQLRKIVLAVQWR